MQTEERRETCGNPQKIIHGEGEKKERERGERRYQKVTRLYSRGRRRGDFSKYKFRVRVTHTICPSASPQRREAAAETTGAAVALPGFFSHYKFSAPDSSQPVHPG